MTKTNILEKKKQRLEFLKNRLKAEESLLKQQERKQRTRRLIELGGLVVKAQLDSLPLNVLLGALMDAKIQIEDNIKLQSKWAKDGDILFSKELHGKVPVIVTFEEKPSSTIRNEIRELGLKWNVFRKEWHGHVVLEELKDLLHGEKVKIMEVN